MNYLYYQKFENNNLISYKLIYKYVNNSISNLYKYIIYIYTYNI